MFLSSYRNTIINQSARVFSLSYFLKHHTCNCSMLKRETYNGFRPQLPGGNHLVVQKSVVKLNSMPLKTNPASGQRSKHNSVSKPNWQETTRLTIYRAWWSWIRDHTMCKLRTENSLLKEIAHSFLKFVFFVSFKWLCKIVCLKQSKHKHKTEKEGKGKKTKHKHSKSEGG